MAEEEDQCPICYTKISIPIAVPGCEHRFCFCCLKGACVDKDEPLCPMCRREVNQDIFSNPKMSGLSLTLEVEPESPGQTKKDDKEVDDKPSGSNNAAPRMFWLYSAGGNGWWRYQPTDEDDIKNAFDSGLGKCDLIICGHNYVIDFKKMEQLRKDNTNMKRKIKHVTQPEMEQLRVRGIAGMRCV